MREQELPFQIFCFDLIRLGGVVVGAIGAAGQQPLITLAPVVLVFALVVIARFGDTNLEEIRVAEHRVGGSESAA